MFCALSIQGTYVDARKDQWKRTDVSLYEEEEQEEEKNLATHVIFRRTHKRMENNPTI